MASALKNLSTYDDANIPDAAEMSFGIVVADWNRDITHALYEACLETLLKHGAKEDNIKVAQVPGASSLPARSSTPLSASVASSKGKPSTTSTSTTPSLPV